MALTKKDIEKLEEEIIPRLRKEVVSELISALQSMNGIEIKDEDTSDDAPLDDEDPDAGVDEEGDDDVDGDEDPDDEGDDADDEGDDDDADDEGEDDEDPEDDEEEDDEADSKFDKIQEELNAIPDALFDQAKTESAGTKVTEMRKELIEYLTNRGIEKGDAEEDVKALSAKEVKDVYADFYARFVDTDGEVHDMDEPYKATRLVDGEETEVFCCNGVPMREDKTEFVCVVNESITQAKPKPKRRTAAKKAAPAKKTAAKKSGSRMSRSRK